MCEMGLKEEEKELLLEMKINDSQRILPFIDKLTDEFCQVDSEPTLAKRGVMTSVMSYHDILEGRKKERKNAFFRKLDDPQAVISSET